MNANEFLEFCKWAGIAGASVGGAVGVYRASRAVYDDIAKRILYWKDAQLNLAGKKRRLIESFIEHDSNGMLPVIYDRERGIFLNANTNAMWDVVSSRVNQAIDEQMRPIREKIYAQQRVLASMAGLKPNTTTQAILEQPEQIKELPGMIAIADLFRGTRPTINNLVLGVSQGGTVTRSLPLLMHTLAVGSSGWGKSKFLHSLIWQIAQAQEPVSVVLIDCSGSAFNCCANWDKLRYPIARTMPQASAVLCEILTEIARRRELYGQYPQVENLAEYTQAASADLEPIVIMADESTAMLGKKSPIGGELGEISQTARQYGIYLLIAGQSAKANLIDTATRDNFTSRLAFHVPSNSSAVVLDDRRAVSIRERGRAWAALWGEPELLELQTPFVTKDELIAVMTTGAAANTMPAPAQPEQPTGQDVVELWESLPEKTIAGFCRALFPGRPAAGKNWQRAKVLLEQENLL
ncbi:MAG: hypothetical protein DRI81_07175 [Chloroflexi bacterium]|nr:MAG: hypothetical protein DRI81_07175 [Chloroflexota bacterium]